MVVRINAARARRCSASPAPLPFPRELLPRDAALRDALRAALAGGATDGAEEVALQRAHRRVTARPLARRRRRARRARPHRACGGSRRCAATSSPTCRTSCKTPLTVGRRLRRDAAPTSELPARRSAGSSSRRSATNTRRMQRIVDDLLDLSRIESGGWRRNVGTRATCARVVHDVFAAAATPRPRPRELHARVRDRRRRGDACTPTRRRSGRCWRNLVENAVRYTARRHGHRLRTRATATAASRSTCATPASASRPSTCRASSSASIASIPARSRERGRHRARAGDREAPRRGPRRARRARRACPDAARRSARCSRPTRASGAQRGHAHRISPPGSTGPCTTARPSPSAPPASRRPTPRSRACAEARAWPPTSPC